MSDGRDQVAVYLDAVDHQPIRRVGVLARERSRSTSVIAFAYDSAWLGMRRLYASAMTLTGRNDHEQAGYLDIVEAIERFGARNSIAQDLEQLFRRVVFNVLTADRDDHLRNHGFLRTPLGWRLSPAFDMNPTPERHEHSLTLDGSVRLPDVEVVGETATFYRLSKERTDAIIGEVRDSVRQWRSVARETEIARDEIERMEDAFAMA